MREMLRIKRSVQATYNTQVNMLAAQFLSSSTATASDAAGTDAMRLLEAKATMAAADAAAAAAARDKQTLKPQTSANIMFVRGETQGSGWDKIVNPDEIDIGESDEEDEAENNDAAAADIAKKLRIEQQAIPAKVFGGLKPSRQPADDDDDDD